MTREPHDLTIGLAIVALAIALSLLAGGVSALLYYGGFVAFGAIVLVLLHRRSEGSTLMAIYACRFAWEVVA